MKINSFVVLAVLLMANYMQGQNISSNTILGNVNTITTAVPFLMITPDARAAGMGETGVATSPDANSIYWNPAKLAFEKNKIGGAFSFTPWLRSLVPDANLYYASLYSQIDSVSTFGISARYFSLGTIIMMRPGGTITQYHPNEYAIDGCYSRRLSNYFSVGISARLIRSDLNNGITINGQDIKTGTSIAVDLGGYYHNNEIKILDKKTSLMFGVAITNIGSKMTYSTSVNKDFIPINLRLGNGIKMNIDPYNQIGFQYEFNKLLVPSPPIYQLGANGSPLVNPNTGAYMIQAGKDPNVGVPQGMLQSFYDAPGGFKEELREINCSVGLEYSYNKTFFARAGYFYEAPQKGNIQFATVGVGVKYNIFGLDFAYLIPTNGQRSPLQNTLRFTLLFEFGKFPTKSASHTPKNNDEYY